MIFNGKYLVDLVREILDGHHAQATYILSPALTVRAVRRGKEDRRQRHDEILLTIGKPNYADRLLIKNALKQDKKCFPILKLK